MDLNALKIYTFNPLLVFTLIVFTTLLCVPKVQADWNDDAMIPFWQDDIMRNESMLPISYSGQTPEAPFLFPPTNIASVKSASLETTYEQGKDWIIENGKLKLPNGSHIPFLKDTDINPPRYPPNGEYPGDVFYPSRQIVVTYTHNSTWQGPIPTFAGIETLPNTIGKLSRHEPLKIVLYGDSIALGWSSSGVLGTPPYLPGWGQLVVDKLKNTYHSAITFTNSSVGGKNSQWGLENIRTNVSNYNPDLVIFAFGMNDGMLDAEIYKNILQNMINDVTSVNPQAEFILVASTIQNPDWFTGNQLGFKTAIQSMTKTGIVMADMTGVHKELLKTKKYIDMTGNNLNHPNDFLARWYAQEIGGILFPPSDSSVGDATISSNDISVSTKVSYGGGITSIRYKNQEYVNLYDHGRGVQIAWQNNNRGECFNSIQHGSRSDAQSTTTTSKLLNQTVTKNSISSTTQAAYWLKPGEQSDYCNFDVNLPWYWSKGTSLNTSIISDNIINQTVSLNPDGLTNTIGIKGNIKFGNSDTSYEPLHFIMLEQPAIAISEQNLPTVYRYDYSSHSLIGPISAENRSNAFQDSNFPMILSSVDKQTAIGFYSNQVPKAIPSSYPQSPATGYGIMEVDNKSVWYLTIRLPHLKTSIQANDILNFQSYIIFGSLADVTNKMDTLVTNHLPIAPDCQKIAWTTKPLEQSSCNLGDLNDDGEVDLFDYNILVANFNKTGSVGFTPADIDKNGKVDLFDYNTLVGNFGK